MEYTIRNSYIERLHCNRIVKQERIPEITSKAIEFFHDTGFDDIATNGKPSIHSDKYGLLATKYPASWSALLHLATMKSREIDYDKIIINPTPDIIKTRNQAYRIGGIFSDTTAYEDGYSLDIGQRLASVLREVIDRKIPFAMSDFRVTRNISKLLLLMELLLYEGIPIATPNYYIENGHVEKRDNIIKAGHDIVDLHRSTLTLDGLGKKHMEALSEYRKQLGW
ncbi:hypothetical protein AGMMS49992_08910 [Clostridia bacterium]|nr:hypothetical protein AGMMS49992_08910 [Clostridia bacterium]